MNRKRQTTIGFLIIVCMLTISGAVPNGADQEQTLSEEDRQALELLEKYAAPGENHRYLDYFVGHWQSVVKMYGEPGQESISQEQQISVKWILGGRYLKAHLRGDIMGKPYEVYVFTGYDNYRQRFFAIQLSTLDTGYFITSGSLDQAKKIRTETGVMEDVGGKKTPIKAVTTLLSPDKYMYEFYTVGAEGKETRTMEITYFRKK
jgi:hypothetical protein